MKNICIVTGSRAEWGLLSRLAGMIDHDPEFQLSIIATNMHLMERYGYTYREIEQEGFDIHFRVGMEVDGDDPKSVVKSVGMGITGFADAYQELKPDLILVLGDRYEILAAVTAALIFNIPVAHLHGGEITEGAFDDAIRHAVTKMSHLHFASTETYRQRIIQMGERPETVFNVGAIGVDNIKHLALWSKEKTEESLDGFTLDRNTILVTYHPVTMEKQSAGRQIAEILAALDEFQKLRVIFTMPNSDTDNRTIAEHIRQWCRDNSERAIWYDSLGQKRYLSVLQYIGCVMGNSSSGIIEVPSFNIPTINIGNRQKGREAARSVMNCPPEKEKIIEKLLLISQHNIPDTEYENPYEQPETAARILNIIKERFPVPNKLFYDLND